MRNSKSNPNRFQRFAYVLGGITVVMMVINVILSAELSQDGLAIDSLMKQQSALKNDIRDTEQRFLAITSLNDLSVKAQTLDYVSPTTIVTINAQTPLAYQCK